MKNLLLLIPILLLISCGGSSKKRDTAVYTLPTQVDQSGTAQGIGGMLKSSNEFLMADHWPTPATLTFKGRNGNTTKVQVTDEKTIATQQFGDLKQITFTPSLNVANHTIVPLGSVSAGAPVLIFRLDRPPLPLTIVSTDRFKIHANAQFNFTPGAGLDDPYDAIKTGTNDIRYGDSSKPWFTVKDGVLTCVGFTSDGHAGSAGNLGTLLPDATAPPTSFPSPHEPLIMPFVTPTSAPIVRLPRYSTLTHTSPPKDK